MFKKIELWFFIFVILLLFVCMILFGSLVRHDLLGGNRFPNLQKIAYFLSSIPSNSLELMRVFKNKQTAYSISNDITSTDVGFVRYKDEIQDSLILLARFDADIGKFKIELIDLLDFNILNEWKVDQELINKKKKSSIFDPYLQANTYAGFNPLIKKNGDLIFNSPLTVVDFCNTVKLINNDFFFHHSNNFDHEGKIWTITKYFPTTLGRQISGDDFDSFEEDAITKLSKDGSTILFRKSLVKILKENNLENFIYRYDYQWDPLHLNDVEPVLNDGPYWKKGDLFLSLRNISSILLYRPSTNKVLNIISGPLKHQHDVDIISEHEISIFNNNVIGTFEKKNKYLYSGYNEIMVYDFKSKKFYKKFNNEIMRLNIGSPTGGIQDILSDSSLLLEETDNGKLHFFNPNGEIVWTYFNRAKDNKLYILNWSRIIEDKNIIDNLRKMSYKNKCYATNGLK